MAWILSFHIIFMVCWFAGIFYLPRLFVYHSSSHDTPSIERFNIMERKLYYGIMMPSAILTTVFGIWLITLNPEVYMKAGWLHTKLVLVTLLWIFHFYCGHLRRQFKAGNNKHTHVYYRIINEIPVVLLAGIVILAVVKPF